MNTKRLMAVILLAAVVAVALLAAAASGGAAPAPKRVWLPIVAKQRVFPSRTPTRTPTATRTRTRTSTRTHTSTPTPTATPTPSGGCSTIPILLNPANGSELDTLVPLYEGDSGSNPSATRLRLEVCRNADCSWLFAALNSGGKAQGTWFWRDDDNLNPGTTYYWRARLECGSTLGAWSPIASFKTGSGGVILPAPNLIAPPNNSTLPGNSVTAQWSAVSGALEYVVQWQQGEWTSYMMETSTQTTIPGLQPNTTYPWWVLARNEYAWGDESAHWQFTTGPAAANAPLVPRDREILEERGILHEVD